MTASYYGHLEVVRTLLECKADVNVKNKVRNQMMMMMMMMILLTILMMIMMMMIVVINYEDRDDCR